MLVECWRGGTVGVGGADGDSATAVTGISGYRIRETAALKDIGSCQNLCLEIHVMFSSVCICIKFFLILFVLSLWAKGSFS